MWKRSISDVVPSPSPLELDLPRMNSWPHAQKRLSVPLPAFSIAPDNSAYSFPKYIVDIFPENYRLFVTGEPLKYVVDFDIGY